MDKKKPRSREEDTLFWREAKLHRVLTKEEEVELANKIAKGGAEAKIAKEKFFLHNMRLVQKIVARHSKSGIQTSDLIQEASIGLMRAIEKFDPTLGFRFSTYASWWIRQAILKSIYSSSSIKLPVNVYSDNVRFKKFMEDHPDLTVDEIQQKTGFTKGHILQLMNMPGISFSLDEDISEESDLRMESVTSTENYPLILDRKICAEEVRVLTSKVYAQQSKRNNRIFMDWIFLDISLQQIGDTHGVTRERARQIIYSTIQKLQKLVKEDKEPNPKKPKR